MDWLLLLKVIGMLVLGYIVVYLIFQCFILTRILSLGCCGFLAYLTYTTELAARVDIRWWLIFLSTLAWLLYRGAKSFEIYETGWLLVDSWGFSVVETAGGIFMNSITALIVTGLIYYFLAPNYPYFYYIVPAAIALLDIISFFTGPD